jgi:hypothetical protein
MPGGSCRGSCRRPTGGPLIAGSYTYGSSRRFFPAWDMEEIGHVEDAPPDLINRPKDPATFIENPRARVS